MTRLWPMITSIDVENTWHNPTSFYDNDTPHTKKRRELL